MMEEIQEITINDKYEPLFEGGKRFYYLTGGRGSAKSFTIALWICMKMLEEGNNILFCRYTLTSVKASIHPTFLDAMKLLGVTDMFNVNNNEIINKENGNILYFRGVKTSSGNQTANLKSLKANIVVFDEFEEIPTFKTWNDIQLSIRERNKENVIVMAQNPSTSESWQYQHFFEHGELETCEYIHTTYFDNPHLSDSFHDEANLMLERDRKMYDHVFLGEWVTQKEGVIFEKWVKGEFDTSLPYVYALDWGFSNDPLAMCKVAIDDKLKRIYIKEEIYQQGLLQNQLVQLLDNIIDPTIITDVGYKIGDNINPKLPQATKKKRYQRPIIADSASPQNISEIRQYGYDIRPCHKFPNSILVLINKIKEYELIVDKDSYNLHKELNNYIWLDKRGKSVPIDNFNHLIDALRYAVGFILRV